MDKYLAFAEWWMKNCELINHRDILSVAEMAFYDGFDLNNKKENKMKIRPLKKNVTIELIKGSKTTNSGIIIQGASEVDRARVLDVGPEVEEVTQGDYVLVNWNKVQKAGDDFIISVDEIIGVINE